GAVQALLEDRGGRIWAGRVFGVSYYDSGTWTRFQSSTIGFSPVHQMLEDSRGRMWFAAGSGLGLWNGVQWRHEQHKQAVLASASVDKMLEDSQGQLWLIGHGGITRVAPDRTAPQTVFRLPPPTISIARDVSFAFGAAYAETADLEFLTVAD